MTLVSLLIRMLMFGSLCSRMTNDSRFARKLAQRLRGPQAELAA
jgi:hypothetical protein